MKSLRLINKIIAGLILVALFFLIVGVAYSYYAARLSNLETNTTITGKTGYMEFEFLGGPEITADDIAPSTEAFITKNFTIKGTNTTDTKTYYKITLVIDENTFSNNAISYTLTGLDADNGELASDILIREGLGTENKSLGIGEYIGKINEENHSYELKLYFYETDDDQLEDLGKTFEAHILIENYLAPSAPDGWYASGSGNLLHSLKTSNEIVNPVTSPGKTISTAEEAVLASAEDDYGTSYYFRGAVTNNYILFADMCWRIVRVTGDGSIKLVLYNYNTGASSCSGTGTTDAFARYSGTTYTTKFNEANNSNAYVGLMYGTPGSLSYAAEHANTNKSTILTNLETWYTNSLATYESKLADTIWCNDKSVDTAYPYGTILGYGSNETGYSNRGRVYANGMYANAAPTLKCPNDTNGGKLSKFTVSDIGNGNGNLTHKIGLLTADEVAYAGGMYINANSTYYLNQNATGASWWSLSPFNFSSISFAYVSGVFSTGYLHNIQVVITYGLRPAVSLKSPTTVTGSGTSVDPYVVSAE